MINNVYIENILKLIMSMSVSKNLMELILKPGIHLDCKFKLVFKILFTHEKK